MGFWGFGEQQELVKNIRKSHYVLLMIFFNCHNWLYSITINNSINKPIVQRQVRTPTRTTTTSPTITKEQNLYSGMFMTMLKTSQMEAMCKYFNIYSVHSID
jgi:hypothetical protein